MFVTTPSFLVGRCRVGGACFRTTRLRLWSGTCNISIRGFASGAGCEPPGWPMAPNVLQTHRHYEGTLFRCSHKSQVLGGLDARFSVYVPDAPRMRKVLPYPEDTEGFPVVFFLSGLTCSDENVITKANAQEHCAANGIIFVAPDTSPRGAGCDGEDARFDIGTGAGFYVNATEAPWSKHYRMWEYIEAELPSLIHAHFPTLGPDWISIMGHSMGGMGALALALRNPTAYRSVSALAPISHPTAVPNGSSPDIRRTFQHYLGTDEASWRLYDPVVLASEPREDGDEVSPPMLVDQGAEDEFFCSGVLRTLDFVEACRKVGRPLDFRLRAGHDHSYFFVASAMEDHIDFHAKHLES